MDNNQSSVHTPLKTGTIMYISHFSIPAPILCVVQEVDGDYIKISLSEHISNIMPGDPGVLKCFEGSHEFVLTGDVANTYDGDALRVLVTNVKKHSNNRKHARFAVSLIAVVVGDDHRDYNCATIKSISLSGLAANCKAEYDPGVILIINIIISPDDVINARGRIVRKNRILEYNEYGVEFQFLDEVNKEKLENYLKKLEEDEKNFIKNISK